MRNDFLYNLQTLSEYKQELEGYDAKLNHLAKMLHEQKQLNQMQAESNKQKIDRLQMELNACQAQYQIKMNEKESKIKKLEEMLKIEQISNKQINRNLQTKLKQCQTELVKYKTEKNRMFSQLDQIVAQIQQIKDCSNSTNRQRNIESSNRKNMAKNITSTNPVLCNF